MVFRIALMGILCSPIGMAWYGILGQPLKTGLWVAFLFGAALGLYVDAYASWKTSQSLKSLEDERGEPFNDNLSRELANAGPGMVYLSSEVGLIIKLVLVGLVFSLLTWGVVSLFRAFS